MHFAQSGELPAPVSVRGVSSLVRHNGALVGEAHRAHGASVRLLTRVGPLVLVNVALLSKPAGAHGASVGLLPGVDPFVLSCFALVAELLGAERATKRAHCFRGVDPLVLRQLAGTPEPLLAVPT